jgi:hypothetical protein
VRTSWLLASYVVRIALSYGSGYVTLGRVTDALHAAGFDDVTTESENSVLWVGVDDEGRADEFVKIVRSWDPDARFDT